MQGIEAVSQTHDKETGYRVYLVPLMVALEIMAEAACSYAPGLLVTAVRNVRAYRRIAVGKEGLNLSVVIQSYDEESGALLVEIVPYRQPNLSATNNTGVADLSSDAEIGKASDDAYVQAEIVLSPRYKKGVAQLSAPADARESKFAKESLYGKGAMFHGPRLQSVEQLFTSNKYQGGRLRSRAATDWFAEFDDLSKFAIDPLLLDNASQLVLYHMFEANIPATALLPFHIDTIEFFADFQNYHGELLRGDAKLFSVGSRGTHADLEVTTAGGDLLCRISGINSRAIILSEELRQFVDHPRKHRLSKPLGLGNHSLSSSVELATISISDLHIDDTTLLWLSDYFLSEEEKLQMPKRSGVEKRRRDWLAGRISAKDAVRTLLNREYGIALCPADISILSAASGAPVVRLASDVLQAPPCVSISHCDGVAVAIASTNKDVLPGLQRIEPREPGFDEIAFTSSERVLLHALSADERTANQSLLWSIKEAAAKATGEGLQRVDQIVVEQINAKNQTATVFNSASRLKDTVHYTRMGSFILAVFLASGQVQSNRTSS